MNQTIGPQINSGNIERHKDVYEYLFNTYYSCLCAYALRYVERKEYAEDVVSDTFYKMWQKGDISIKTSLQGYLFQAVYNNCMYFIRQQNSEQQKHLEIQKEFENTASGKLLGEFTDEDSLILKEIEEAIEKAINDLPQQARTVFILKRHQGLKNKEIAKQLDISVKTVEMHMTRALAFLRDELKGYCPVIVAFYLSVIQ
ncbi:RNA polymerase sigma-70 factor [Carboxylicivirga sediminis]|uniref:RNA polymerase sigma-70 factor n=1 Tax=Carboxylicivirga sediminis TaxID=2006564 RepID=A0A941F5K7_9BACT|nr:RNA polymerase sigma-70 factor [Carboxylicivirga sediminis]MBR8536348.1 RNA polymerase sigma-70 factor [Carboxylicivirga sediminis]